MSTQGGKPIGIRVVTQADLDSGVFRLSPGPAVRVTGMAPETRGVTSGPLAPVFVVDASYNRGIEGGEAAIPVSNLTATTRPVEHNLAIPIFVVSDDGQFAAPPSGPVAAVLRLTWDDNANNEDDQEIERDIDGAGFVLIDTVAANVETYDDNVMTQAIYTYRVRAHNVAGYSAYSNEDSIAI